MTYLEEGKDSAIYEEAGKLYWEGLDEAGWLAVEFSPPGYIINVLTLKGYDSLHMPKDILFQGGFISPYFAEDYEWYTLVSGTCSTSTDWQSFYFDNYNKFPYYRLVIENTFGHEVQRLCRWQMFYQPRTAKKRVVSKISLLPSVSGDNEKYFPKRISFYGSNDYNNWTPLFEDKLTATPYFESSTHSKWQDFSFVNDNPFWAYKLVMYDNWEGTNDRFMIDEWEMYELAYEANIKRILTGDSNNINSIWANSDATIDKGWVYVANDDINYLFDGQFALSKQPTDAVRDIQEIRNNN